MVKDGGMGREEVWLGDQRAGARGSRWATIFGRPNLECPI